MPQQNCKCIGILGGMGPESTALFFQKIIRFTPAKKDQEHIKIIIYNDPQIPDRTTALLNMGESPLHMVKKDLVFLERSGVDFIVIPCVTMHYYYEEMTTYIKTPIVNMVQEIVSFIKTQYPGSDHIGILATSGTIRCRIFQSALQQESLVSILPDHDEQELLMDSIYGEKGIKAGFTDGHPKEQIIGVAGSLIRNGAEVVIAGCTEIPIVLKQEDIGTPLVDSLDVLAKAAIMRVGLNPI
jgi:aspartate racemase